MNESVENRVAVADKRADYFKMQVAHSAGLDTHFWIQFLTNGIIIWTLLYVLMFFKEAQLDLKYQIFAVFSTLLALTFYTAFQVLEDWVDPLTYSIRLLKAWSSVALTIVFVGFLTKTSALFSREIVLEWFVLGYLLQLLGRLSVSNSVDGALANENKENALLVGSGDIGKSLLNRIQEVNGLPHKLVGVVDFSGEGHDFWGGEGGLAIWDMSSLDSLIKKHNVKCVYIALPMQETFRLEKLYYDLLSMNIDIKWTPDFMSMKLVNPNMAEIGGFPVISLSQSPLKGDSAILKLALDKSLAFLGLLLLSPLMLLIAAAIKFAMPGPVFFRQRRHGFNGQVINIWKFRSMVMHKEEDGKVTQATQDDIRVTPFGKFLRKTSLDELPQLFNVLSGEMSLVGPRPHAVEHNEYYSEKITAYLARHRIKPGITGLAQVNGHRGETKTIARMKARVDYDLEYINNWSISMDLKILAKTIFVLYFNKGY